MHRPNAAEEAEDARESFALYGCKFPSDAVIGSVGGLDRIPLPTGGLRMP